MWNYRLIEQETWRGVTVLSLVEVYYEDGVPLSCDSSISLCGFEDKRELENAIGLMGEALFKPVLYRDADGSLKEKV